MSMSQVLSAGWGGGGRSRALLAGCPGCGEKRPTTNEKVTKANADRITPLMTLSEAEQHPCVQGPIIPSRGFLLGWIPPD